MRKLAIGAWGLLGAALGGGVNGVAQIQPGLLPAIGAILLPAAALEVDNRRD